MSVSIDFAPSFAPYFKWKEGSIKFSKEEAMVMRATATEEFEMLYDDSEAYETK